jgi:molecular chaperone GrpE
VSKNKTKPIAEAEAAQPQADAPDGNAAPAAATAELEQALAASQQQAKEYLENWQRERADFVNYKKRAERELRESQEYARINALTTLLPVIDDFDLAMTNLPDELKDQPWLEGVAAIQRKFNRILDEHGIVVIDPVGEPFDPNQHEALGMDSDTDQESGHVTMTLQKGYRCGDRVLRPALVRVAG